MYLKDDPRFFDPWYFIVHGIYLWYFDPFSFLGVFGPFWRKWGYIRINDQLPFIYGEGIVMLWTIFGGILVVKVKMEKIMVGL